MRVLGAVERLGQELGGLKLAGPVTTSWAERLGRRSCALLPLCLRDAGW